MLIRRWLFSLLTLVGVFATGFSLALMAQHSRVPGAALLVCSLIATSVLSANLYRRVMTSSRASMQDLLHGIRTNVTRLTEAGYDILVPESGDPETARLLVRVETDGTVIVEKEQWSGVYYRYSIEENGRVRRSVIDERLTTADRQWCRGKLTGARLEYLLAALTGAYAPRRRVYASRP